MFVTRLVRPRSLIDLGCAFAYVSCSPQISHVAKTRAAIKRACELQRDADVGHSVAAVWQTQPRRGGSPPTGPWSSHVTNLLHCCLSIFDRYCLRLWGRIKVAAQVGSGSRFFLKSPVAPNGRACGLLAFVGSYFIPPFSQIADATVRPAHEPSGPSARNVHIGHSLAVLSILSGNGLAALSS